mgnify:CR=1 FL=1
MAKKAILVVSFGTSVNATREKTIDRIEADIQKVMPDRAFYRAWISSHRSFRVQIGCAR